MNKESVGGLRLGMTVEQCWQRAPGGSATYIVELSRALVENMPQLEGVGIAARHSDSPPPDLLPGFPVEHSRLPRRFLYDAWNGLRRPSPRGVGALDVIHATTWAIPPANCPLVVTVHDLAFLRAPDHFTKRGNRFFRKALEIVKEEGDAVIVPSECTAKDCREAGIEPGQIVVIPHGMRPVARDAATIDEFRRKHKLDRPYLMWCGTVEPRKNLPVLIEAFGVLATKHSDLDLVIVGPQGWGDLGLDSIWPSGLDSDRIKTLGRLESDDLHSAYAGAKAFCFPSIWEGFGLPVLEAMSHGIPVVSTSDTSMSEIGGDAILTAAAEDVDGFVEKLELALGERSEELSAAGSARAKRFSWNESARHHLEVYMSLARHGS